MRVLCVNWAWPSHFMPLVPVLSALRAAGAEVRVASQPLLQRIVTDAGLPFTPAGADVDHSAIRARTAAAAPPVADIWNVDENARMTQVFAVFAERARLMLDDTVALAERWRPDLVFFEPTSFAGPLVAALLGVPAIRHIHGVDMTYRARGATPALVAPLAEQLGIALPNLLGSHTVDPCPPSLQIATDTTSTTVRYIPYNGPATIPAWLAEPPTVPRICLTWGTTVTAQGGEFLLPEVLAALDGLELDVVVTVRPAEIEHLGPLPSNVRAVSGLALHLLMPSCALVIHQGGFGTMLTAVDAGVPQLLLPQFPHHMLPAEQLRGTGAAAVLPVAEFDRAVVRDLVVRLVGDSPERAATQVLRAELRAQPTPAQIAPDLLALGKGTR
ncbi:glycosyltransferase [Nocardia brasiliensis]|uniref:glycosyltransferase n=1 Tax=Nocardia brasiliensis TaxID=37326 RepID=UPI002453B63E|nr:glycosyltransferase [Nocardia brasiliensis]